MIVHFRLWYFGSFSPLRLLFSIGISSWCGQDWFVAVSRKDVMCLVDVCFSLEPKAGAGRAS